MRAGSVEPEGPETDTVVNVEDVVREWIAGDATMWDACHDAPEVAWEAIRHIATIELTDDQKALLAAGPIETLLAWHGEMFIERVEKEAAANPRFRYLLGGVWQNRMSMEVWNRVQQARSEVW